MRKSELRQIIKEEISKVLNEENSILTQEDFNILEKKGFEINFSDPEHNLFWLERNRSYPRADFGYLLNLLENKNIPFEVKYWRGDGDKGQTKEIWIDTKYTNVPYSPN